MDALSKKINFHLVLCDRNNAFSNTGKMQHAYVFTLVHVSLCWQPASLRTLHLSQLLLDLQHKPTAKDTSGVVQHVAKMLHFCRASYSSVLLASASLCIHLWLSLAEELQGECLAI